MITYEELIKVFDLDNPLTLEYFELCSKDTDEPKYFEKHHILPRSMFQEYIKEPWNIVRLSYRQHYKAHEILPQICIKDEHKIKMVDSWKITCHNKITRDFISVENYELLKSIHHNLKVGRKRHPSIGLKISKSKTGVKRSDSDCKAISLAKQGIPWSEKQRSARNYNGESSIYSYEVYSLDGVYIKTYKYAKDFILEGFSRSRVCDVCNGNRKQHKGFIFKKIVIDTEPNVKDLNLENLKQ